MLLSPPGELGGQFPGRPQQLPSEDVRAFVSLDTWTLIGERNSLLDLQAPKSLQLFVRVTYLILIYPMTK